MHVAGLGAVMRHLSIAIIAAVSTVVFAPVASAADMPRKAPVVTPPPPPVYSWTGFYVGANIGGGWADRDVTSIPNDPLVAAVYRLGGAPPPISFKSSSVIGGLQLGYNWQFNRNWLVGIEADFDWSGIDGSGTSTGVITIAQTQVPITQTASEKINWFGTVRARLGFLPVDNLLAYVTGGFAYGRVEHSATYINNSAAPLTGSGFGFSFTCGPFAPCFAGSSSDVVGGWTVGGGVEYAIWQRWTLRAEYLYVSLDNKSVTQAGTALLIPGSTLSSTNANFDRTTFNVARIALNYKFGDWAGLNPQPLPPR